MNFLSIDLDNGYDNDDVDTFELSIRARNCLSNEGIKTIGQLIEHSVVEINRIPNCGTKTLNEIRYVLAEIGLTLKDESCNLEEIKMEMEQALSPSCHAWRLWVAREEKVKTERGPAL